jgi:hypothetical protein
MTRPGAHESAFIADGERCGQNAIAWRVLQKTIPAERIHSAYHAEYTSGVRFTQWEREFYHAMRRGFHPGETGNAQSRHGGPHLPVESLALDSVSSCHGRICG